MGPPSIHEHAFVSSGYGGEAPGYLDLVIARDLHLLENLTEEVALSDRVGFLDPIEDLGQHAFTLEQRLVRPIFTSKPHPEEFNSRAPRTVITVLRRMRSM